VIENELAEYQGCYNYNLQKYTTNLETATKKITSLDSMLNEKDNYLNKKENILKIRKTKKSNSLIVTTNLEEIIKNELIDPTIINDGETKDKNKLELWENKKKRKRRNKVYSIKLKKIKITLLSKLQ